MSNTDKKYYYKDSNGQTQGAFSEKELKRLKLSPTSLIWCKGLTEWIEYSQLFQTSAKKKKSFLPWIITAIFLIVGIIIWGVYATSIHSRLMKNSYESEEFDMYLDKYYRDIESFGISIVKPRNTSIRFASMQYFKDTKDYYGLCYGYDDDSVIEIYINEDAWAKLTRAQKYLIMYHELSHDLLNVDDLPNTYENQDKLMCPAFNRFEKLTMDDFIETTHTFFEEYLATQY